MLTLFCVYISGIYEAAPLAITRTQYGSELTSPVLFGVNQTVSIWCRADARAVSGFGSRALVGLNWRYVNGTILPKVYNGESSDYDVYRESFVGNNSAYSHVRWTILHFNRIQPSYAGFYFCVANYKDLFRNESVKVQVSGVWMVLKLRLN